MYVSRFSRYRCHTNILSTLFLYTFLRLPRDWHRLVARHFKLGSKDQEPNLKCQDVYQKLLASFPRSEEHTSELQSRENLVCRLLLEKKNTKHHLAYNTLSDADI